MTPTLGFTGCEVMQDRGTTGLRAATSHRHSFVQPLALLSWGWELVEQLS